MKQLGIRPKDCWYDTSPKWSKRGRHREYVPAGYDVDGDEHTDFWIEFETSDCCHRGQFCVCWDDVAQGLTMCERYGSLVDEPTFREIYVAAGGTASLE